MIRILSFALTLALATGAQAEIVRIPAAGLSMDIPSVWATRKKGDKWSGKSADGHVEMLVWTVSSDETAEARTAMDKILADNIQSGRWDSSVRKSKLGNLEIRRREAQGVSDGRKVTIEAIMVGGTPTGKVLVILLAIDRRHKGEHEVELENIGASLKPSDP